MVKETMENKRLKTIDGEKSTQSYASVRFNESTLYLPHRTTERILKTRFSRMLYRHNAAIGTGETCFLG